MRRALAATLPGLFSLCVYAQSVPDARQISRTRERGLLSLNRGPGDPVIEEVISIYDGSNLWAYNTKTNEYRVYVVPNLPRDSRPEDADLYEGIAIWRHADEVFAGSKLLRQESIAIAGGSVECFVIQATHESDTTTLWIDKSKFHVLRMEGAGSSEVFSTVKLDEPLSDDLFKFKPPASAKKLK
jgi:outer membrane lipoprotein-sorting protein